MPSNKYLELPFLGGDIYFQIYFHYFIGLWVCPRIEIPATGIPLYTQGD